MTLDYLHIPKSFDTITHIGDAMNRLSVVIGTLRGHNGVIGAGVTLLGVRFERGR